MISAEERLKNVKRFFINLNGERYEVFPAGSEAAVRFPRIEFVNPEGKVIGKLYVRSEGIEPAMKHSIHLTQFHGDWYQMTPLETQHISSTTIAS